jgi:hypothetical protein
MSVSSAMSIGWSVLAWGGLLYAVWLVWNDQRALGAAPGRKAYRSLAVLGFAVTWTFMIAMTRQDIARYPDFSAWFVQSNLFFDAYRRVTDSAAAWWWSQQLLLWAPAAVLFFHVESKRRGQSHWQYTWVGLCVAVSVALPLFLCRLEAATTRPERPSASTWWTGGCLFVAAVAAALLPVLDAPYFLWCIVTVHVGVLLSPLPIAPRVTSARLTQGLYAAFAGIAAVSWWATLLHLWQAQAAPLWHVVWDDPAQSSISLDVLVTILVCCLWVLRADGPRGVMRFALTTACCSLGGAFCLRELARLRRES